MKGYLNFTAIILLTVFISSCKTTEYITKVETKTDTIKIEKTIVDTIFQQKIIEKTKEVKANVFLPCPDDEQNSNNGQIDSGDNHAKWEYDNERKGYNVELYCAEQINRLDSINRRLTIENKELKKSESTTIEETLIKKDNFLDKIYKYLFFIILFLWFFGITPKTMFKLLVTR